VTDIAPDGKQPPRRVTWLARVRSGAGVLDIVVGVLLAAMLLPLLIGPFVVGYQFAQAGDYISAGLVGSVFAVCVILTIRAVRRGEFGPGLFGAALVLVAFLIFMARRIPR
jgi:hypothetical protein